MDSQSQRIEELLTIREHDFQSAVPVVGPLIRLVRCGLYQLTAKWGVRVVIEQQNRINQMIVQYLREYDARLVDQDRDLAHLARVVAELEIRYRHLAKLAQSQSSLADKDSISTADE
jgi:hypothetical protein